jgi:hypothetical protein
MRIPPYAVAAVSASWLALAAMATTAHSAAGIVDPHDLEGTWTYATMTPLERPQELAGKERLTPEEAAAFEGRTNARQAATNNTAGPDWWDPGTRTLVDRRTSLIVDPVNGRLPPLTPDAQARATARAQARRERGPSTDVEELALNERCLLWATAGPPMLPGVYNNNVKIVQTIGAVVIFNEMIHDARVIPTRAAPPSPVPRWQGDSRGRWEGGTFIVDTVNFTEKTSVRGSDARLHLVERFTRVDADTITYRFTVDDPTVWSQPWTAEFPLRRTTGRIFEYACHEGNFRSIEGILRASRAQLEGR